MLQDWAVLRGFGVSIVGAAAGFRGLPRRQRAGYAGAARRLRARHDDCENSANYGSGDPIVLCYRSPRAKVRGWQ
jgi:hypothetical protein